MRLDMTNDRRLVTRVVDARAGYEPVVGSYAVVGDEGDRVVEAAAEPGNDDLAQVRQNNGEVRRVEGSLGRSSSGAGDVFSGTLPRNEPALLELTFRAPLPPASTTSPPPER